MAVRYKGGSQYVLQSPAPAARRAGSASVCARRAIDRSVAAAFLAAVAPAEIDAWARTRKVQRQSDESLAGTPRMQQVDRLR